MGHSGKTTSTVVGRIERPIASRSSSSTFGNIADQFLTSQKSKLSPSSLVWLESTIRRFKAFFQDETIFATISEKQIRDFIRQRARESAPGSLRLEFGALKRIFRMAYDGKLITTNPASNISVPREKIETRYLTPDDFCRVRDASPDWLKEILDFCVGTGLRRQELLRARWEDVIEIDGEVFLCVSHGGSDRKIPLNELAKHALQSARSHSNPAKGRIFRGKSVTSTNLSLAFTRACRAAKVGTRVSFKDLRHTSALWMKQEGVPLETIASFLGYANAHTAVRYVQGLETGLNKAVGTLDRVAKRRRSSGPR